MNHSEHSHTEAQQVLCEVAQERAEAQRIQRERLQRGSLWFGAVLLFGLLLGLMLGRLVNPLPPPWATPPARVLAVLAEPQAEGWTLRLHLSRPVTYRRVQQSGAVSLSLGDLHLAGGEQRGRIEQPGLEGSWQLLQRGAEVQLLLVSLGGPLQVSDSWQTEGEQGWLTVKVLPSVAP